LGTQNYLKKITNLQLIFSDNMRSDVVNAVFTRNNNMFYKIKTYRKKSKMLNGNFTGHIDTVGIQRLKVRLPKCDFAEIILSNYDETAGNIELLQMFSNGKIMNLDMSAEDPFETKDNIQNVYDRLNLIGITFKILLSEGVS
jgi:hypothetical protein